MLTFVLRETGIFLGGAYLCIDRARGALTVSGCLGREAHRQQQGFTFTLSLPPPPIHTLFAPDSLPGNNRKSKHYLDVFVSSVIAAKLVFAELS